MTGIVSAVSAALGGPFGWLVLTALAALAAMAALAAITLAWLIRAAVRGWKRASEVIAEAQAMVADAGICPWCKVRECNDPKQCTCDDPCGMRYCAALTAEQLLAEGDRRD